MSRQGMRERIRSSPDSPRMSDRDRMSPPDDRYDPRPPKYGSRPRSMERDHDRAPPPPPPSREYRSRPRDDYRDPPPYVDHHSAYDDRPSSYTRRDPEYSSLRITGFPSHVSDMAVRDALFHEFKKFGEVNIRVTYSGEDRVAYANYRLQEDARNARSAKGTRITMFARPLHIDCVFKRYDQYGNNRGRGRGRGYYHQGSDYQSRPQSGGRGYSSDSSYDRDYNYNKRRSYESGHHERDVTLLPEEDPKATRTVFVGNLEENVTPEQLRREFEKHGIVEDVDIKFGARGQGNPFAFVKFLNLNMAYKAITTMSGHYIGRNQIKLGYGKISPTSCLWIGGLGTWTSLSVLEREFDRFGAIRKIDYTKGETFAYIFYETLDAAEAAAEHMRGYALGGPDRRLRIDFVDPERLPRAPPSYGHSSVPRGRDEMPVDYPEYENEYFRGSKPPTNNYRERRGADSYAYEKEKGWDRERRDWAPGVPEEGEMPPRTMRRKRPHSPDSDYSRGSGQERPMGYKPPRSPEDKAEWSPGPPLEGASSSPEINDFEGREKHKRGRSSDSSSSGHLNGKQHKKHKKAKKSKVLNGVTTVRELVEHFPVAWDGFYGLKNSAFATSMHVVAGDRSLLEVLLPDGMNADENTLRIAQRFRLDQPKLEEVAKRIFNAGPNGYAILVAVPQAEEPKELPTGTQARTLRNLVSYLQQKKAAGVIILPVNQTDEKEKGVLYAFPPCEYAHQHLLTVAPDLGPNPSEEDHFVVIIVKGVA